jgi:hypothetical protein
MNRVVPLISVVGILAIGLAMVPALGLPYGHFDWIVLSQEYERIDNLALNRPAIASTYRAGHPPSFAVDGNEDTTWESYSRYREWLYVILDRPQRVNGILVNWGAGYATRYRIGVLVGDYPEYWQPVYDETSGDGELDFVTFPSTYGRAVVIDMFGAPQSTPYFSIREFEVFYFPEDTDESGNLAGGRPTYATTYQPGYEPANATDADLSTSWRPDPRMDAYATSIFVDLGDTYDVARVNLHWGDLRANWYRLYAWTFVWSGPFGQWAWWPIYSGSSSGGEDTATFQPISTRYVRLVAYNDAGQGFDVKEFEVYSDAQASPGDSDTPSAHDLTPDMAKEGAEGVLRDLVPPGWEHTPEWQHITPSKGEISVPELLPLR